MNSSCRDFRDRLASALGGPGGAVGGPGRAPAEALRSLAWHEHLLACDSCRALLEAEEALDDLLTSLPEPRLPAGVATRVLQRLALDRLLERAGAEPVPAGLARRVLAGLEGARADAALDRLLGMVPAPVVPRGLAARTLAALADERTSARDAERAARPAPPLRRRAPSPLTLGLRLAAAAALLLGGGLGLRALLRSESRPDEDVAVIRLPDAPPPELLESLELLEAWELITDDSLDVVLTSLDTADEVLLEIDQGNDPLEPLPEEPSKG